MLKREFAKTMTLSDLESGQQAVITKVKGRGAFRKRINEMGFTRGRVITRIKNAPLNDPIEFKLMYFNISLRKSEAEQIQVVSGPEMAETNDEHGSFLEIPPQKIARKVKEESSVIDIALVGNPNSGKTTLFNAFTGANQRVGNYSGVTVNPFFKIIHFNGHTLRIHDLPGTYSLSAYSPDEALVRRFLLEEQPDIVINIVDASNLERNLYLTSQLIDMDLKMVMCLNMFDEFEKSGDQLDQASLSQLLGMPIVDTVASKGKGIKELFEKVIDLYEQDKNPYNAIKVRCNNDVEDAIDHIQDEITPFTTITDKISPRLLAMQLLENDKTAEFYFDDPDKFKAVFDCTKLEAEQLEKLYQEEASTLISEARYAFIAGALKETLQQKAPSMLHSTSDKIDKLLTHKFIGFPIFLVFLWILFEATFTLGSYPMDWIEMGVGGLSDGLSGLIPEGFIKDLLINGIIEGTGSVLVFLPNIVILFFFIALMEDSGYMARAAFIMDKLMHRLGLHGKSFIPLLMGFGCNVPAIMGTRTIENPKDRLLTMMIIPFMSCSARLPVYIILVGAFFPAYPVLMLFSLYIFGMALAVVFSYVFNKLIFKTGQTPFVMELPPYRIPTIKSVFKHMWFRAYMYLKKVGGLILIASIVIWTLQYFPRDISFSRDYDGLISEKTVEMNSLRNTSEIEQLKTSITALEAEKEFERTEKSYLGMLGKTVSPVFEPLGFDWKITISLITGIVAKEVVISTMGVLFKASDAEEDTGEGELSRSIQKHFNTISDAPPPLTALSLLLFVLIYFPCIGVVITLAKEAGHWKWAVFSMTFTTVLAWIVSFFVFQIGQFFL